MEAAADKTPPFRDIVRHDAAGSANTDQLIATVSRAVREPHAGAAEEHSAGSSGTPHAAQQHSGQREQLSLWRLLKAATKRMKQQLVVLYYASQDPDVGWPSKAVAGFALAYAASPLDLIPDAIPVLGELVILPSLIWLAVHVIPEPVLQRAQQRAERAPFQLHENLKAAAVIMLIWDAGIFALVWLVCSQWGRGWVADRPLLPAAIAAGVLLVVEVIWLVFKARAPHRSKGGGDEEQATRPLLSGSGGSCAADSDRQHGS